MLKEFDRSSAARVLDWFDGFPFDPAFLAYARSDDRVQIWADSDEKPTIAAMLSSLSMVGFVMGDRSRAGEVLESFLSGGIFRLRPRVILSVPDHDWCQALIGSITLKCWRVPRIDYQFIAKPPILRADIPPEIALVPLEDSLLEGIRAECDPEFDRDYFKSLQGFGWAATEGGRVVSVAWSPALAGWAELGVATASSHRRRGLARAVGAAVLGEAMLRNLTPHVTTDQRNLPARKWAQSLGFANETMHEWVVITKMPVI